MSEDKNPIEKAADAAVEAAESVTDAAAEAADAVTDAAAAAVDTVADTADAAVEAVAETAGAAADAASDVAESVVETVTGAADDDTADDDTDDDAEDTGLGELGEDEVVLGGDVVIELTPEVAEAAAEAVADAEEVEGPAEFEAQAASGRGRGRGRGRSRRIGGDIDPEEINYKNVALLGRFLDARGRILSRRKTRVSAKIQRQVVREIKRARHLALLPYTAEHIRVTRRGGRSRQR